MHPKTLATSILGKDHGVSDALSISFAHLTQEIYEVTDKPDLPLHRRIDAWRALHNGERLDIEISDCKCLFMPRQRLLNKIDPGNVRPLQDVQDEVEQHAAVFLSLFTEDDESHREMTLRKMLDAAEDFYVLNFRPE